MRPFITTIEAELADLDADSSASLRAARIRALLERELEHGRGELALGRTRSGYEAPVLAVFSRLDEHNLLALLPIDPLVRIDLRRVGEHALLVAAAAIGALAEEAPKADRVTAGAAGGMLALGLSNYGLTLDREAAAIAALVFDELIAQVDRIRARALAPPAEVLPPIDEELRPLPSEHWFDLALLYARVGINPADREATAAGEDLIAPALALRREREQIRSRPHDDPDPTRRAARRILQRLAGMGKWGGYHTEFTHLARGFPDHEKAAVERVGEALIEAGLLTEKRSVGQRHVYLEPRRKADITRLIETGEIPEGLRLPEL